MERVFQQSVRYPVWIAVAICSWSWGFAAETGGTVSVAVGSVTLRSAAGAPETAVKVGDGVPVGAIVQTGAGSRAVIKTTRQSAVRLAENTQVVFSELVESEATPKVLLDLKAGSLGALIQPQAQTAMDFKVKTPTGIAAARGTLFAVAVENGKGYVKVEHGKVDVTPANAPKAEPKTGKVTEVSGTVTESTAARPVARALKVGDTVSEGSTIKTGAASKATVVLTTTSAIHLGPNTETVIVDLVESRELPKVLLDLKNGTVGALVKPKVKGQMDFKIKTPSGVAAARGTYYTVAVENGIGYVQTKEGEVTVIPLNKP